MTKRALIIGGTGQVGRAAASRLVTEGWDIRLTSRRPPPEIVERNVRADSPTILDHVEFLLFDREDSAALRHAADGSDLVVDAVAYEEHHADQLVELDGSVGSLIVISTGSVAIDSRGFTFDEATSPQNFPKFPVPMTEDQPTIRKDLSNPENRTYSALKAEIERRVLACTDTPVTILRPGAIHGPHSYALREWYFIKRALDRRPHAVLAYDGESVFSTSSAANIAELIHLVSEKPGAGVLNAVDEDYLTVAEIGQTIWGLMGHTGTIETIPGPPQDDLGRSPWALAHPLVMDMSKAKTTLNYRAARTYSESVREDIDWITSVIAKASRQGHDWRDDFPSISADKTRSWFNYEREDDYLRRTASGRGAA